MSLFSPLQNGSPFIQMYLMFEKHPPFVLPRKTQALSPSSGQTQPGNSPWFLMHRLLPHGHVLGVLLQPVQGRVRL